MAQALTQHVLQSKGRPQQGEAAIELIDRVTEQPLFCKSGSLRRAQGCLACFSFKACLCVTSAHHSQRCQAVSMLCPQFAAGNQCCMSQGDSLCSGLLRAVLTPENEASSHVFSIVTPPAKSNPNFVHGCGRHSSSFLVELERSLLFPKAC